MTFIRYIGVDFWIVFVIIITGILLYRGSLYRGSVPYILLRFLGERACSQGSRAEEYRWLYRERRYKGLIKGLVMSGFHRKSLHFTPGRQSAVSCSLKSAFYTK